MQEFFQKVPNHHQRRAGTPRTSTPRSCTSRGRSLGTARPAREALPPNLAQVVAELSRDAVAANPWFTSTPTPAAVRVGSAGSRAGSSPQCGSGQLRQSRGRSEMVPRACLLGTTPTPMPASGTNQADLQPVSMPMQMQPQPSLQPTRFLRAWPAPTPVAPPQVSSPVYSQSAFVAQSAAPSRAQPQSPITHGLHCQAQTMRLPSPLHAGLVPTPLQSWQYQHQQLQHQANHQVLRSHSPAHVQSDANMYCWTPEPRARERASTPSSTPTPPPPMLARSEVCHSQTLSEQQQLQLRQLQQLLKADNGEREADLAKTVPKSMLPKSPGTPIALSSAAELPGGQHCQTPSWNVDVTCALPTGSAERRHHSEPPHQSRLSVLRRSRQEKQAAQHVSMVVVLRTELLAREAFVFWQERVRLRQKINSLDAICGANELARFRRAHTWRWIRLPRMVIAAWHRWTNLQTRRRLNQALATAGSLGVAREQRFRPVAAIVVHGEAANRLLLLCASLRAWSQLLAAVKAKMLDVGHTRRFSLAELLTAWALVACRERLGRAEARLAQESAMQLSLRMQRDMEQQRQAQACYERHLLLRSFRAWWQAFRNNNKNLRAVGTSRCLNFTKKVTERWCRATCLAAWCWVAQTQSHCGHMAELRRANLIRVRAWHLLAAALEAWHGLAQAAWCDRARQEISLSKQEWQEGLGVQTIGKKPVFASTAAQQVGNAALDARALLSDSESVFLSSASEDCGSSPVSASQPAKQAKLKKQVRADARASCVCQPVVVTRRRQFDFDGPGESCPGSSLALSLDSQHL